MDIYWAGLPREAWEKIIDALEKDGSWEAHSLAEDIKRFILPDTNQPQK